MAIRNPLSVLSSHKRGVGGGGVKSGTNYQGIRLVFVDNRRCFLGTLKALLSWFKLQKTGYSI
jgi:hypothetical protein